MEDKFDLDALMDTLSTKEIAVTKTSVEIATLGFEGEQLQHLHSLCQSKAEEFALIGYDKINQAEIWRYITSKYKDGTPQLHRIVNEILSLKITTFMNWETINAYKGI